MIKLKPTNYVNKMNPATKGTVPDIPINMAPNGFVGIIIVVFMILMLGIGFSCLSDLGNANLKFTHTKLATGKEY